MKTKKSVLLEAGDSNTFNSKECEGRETTERNMAVFQISDTR